MPKTTSAGFNRFTTALDPVGDLTVANPDGTQIGAAALAASTTAVAAALAANTVVKASAGRLFKVIVTATGANPLLIFDNASTNAGTVIGALPASPAVGATFDFMAPAALGITVGGSATNPGVTVSWA